MTDTRMHTVPVERTTETQLIVRERQGRWWIVYETTPLMQLEPEVTAPTEALKKARKLYPQFEVHLQA